MRRFLAAGGAVGFLCTAGAAAQTEPIAEGQVVVRGASLVIYDDGETSDVQQTVNVGERARIRTCFGVPADAESCGDISPGDPRIAGLQVRAELRGPELPTAQQLVGLPGGSLVLPGFQQAGDYSVENLRLVDDAGNTLAFAHPRVAVVQVREIVLASARVRTLSLDELRARGIAFDAENFQAFDFRVGFAFEDEIVELELPIAYDDFGGPVALAEPRLASGGIEPTLEAVVRRWKPPSITPFLLERPDVEKELPNPEELAPIDLPLLGAIVMPGTVTVLNQFFEAQMVVVNGAGEGSAAILDDLEATIRFPSGALRIEDTEPARAFGAAVPMIRADGSRALAPGDEGAATWVLEGLRAGSHVVRMELVGQLDRPGREPFAVASVVQASLDVIDPRFHLTFTHPDVVNEGQPYSLFVTVTNLSSATQNLVTVQLLDQILSGVRKADPLDDLRRHIDELAPGEAATVEYPLVAEITGRAVASAFEADSSNTSGSIRFVAGVGELGIPLSPATLRLSRYTANLRPPFVGTDDFLDAQIRLLSLLHGLASAPAAWAPPGLPSATLSDVRRRAEDLGEAGQRVFLQEGVLETLEVLLLDLLGNRFRGDADDVLRRTTDRGARAVEAFATEVRRQQGLRALSAVDLFRHFLSTTSYAEPYVAAIHESSGSGVTVRVASEDDAVSTHFETLPYAAALPVSGQPGSAASAELIVVGRLQAWEQDGTGLAVRINNDAAVARTVSLEVALPGANGLERFDFGTFAVPAGADWTLPLSRLRVGSGWLDFPTSAEASGPTAQVETVSLPPFRALGAVQEFSFGTDTVNVENSRVAGNIYGNGVLLLFNRPPHDSIRNLAASFHVTASFHGLDTAGEAASLVLEKPGTAVYVQPSERVVAVRFSQPISALQEAGADLIDHSLTLAPSIVDRAGNPLQAPTPELVVETSPQHVGGLVAGQVRRGDGTPVEGARVTLARTYRPPESTFRLPGRTTVGEVTTGADGRYAFDFVESPSWNPRVLSRATLVAEIPEGADPDLEPASVQEAGLSIRSFNRVHRLNIALIGRGIVEGSVRYEDGSPVPCDAVLGCPRVFAFNAGFLDASESRIEPDGSFRVGGVSVGAVTLKIEDSAGRVGYQTVSITRPGEVVSADLVIPLGPPRGVGEIVVRVEGREFDSDETFPVAGATVAVYNQGNLLEQLETGAGGIAAFVAVPEGRVTVQAADFSISRSSAITSLELLAGERRDVSVLLEAAPGRSVTGSVFYDDPFSGEVEPVIGAVVEVASAGQTTVTDEQGRYRFDEMPVQGVLDSAYVVRAVDPERRLEGTVQLPQVLSSSPDSIEAQPIVITGTPTGTIEGVVIDEFGRPVSGAAVYFRRQRPSDETGPPATTAPDGTFSITGRQVGEYALIAAIGTGLAPWPLGAFGQGTVAVSYAGHRAFVSIRMAGSGTLRIKSRTAQGPSQALIFYRPTYFSIGAVEIVLRGEALERSTDPNGDLLLPMPVGAFQVVAYGPFSGTLDVFGRIDYPGQILDLDLEFPLSSTVEGTLLDVDGVSPVSDVEVAMRAGRFRPQRQTTDALGRFRFELVPAGPVELESEALLGSVLRFASLLIPNVGAGSEVDVDLVMKEQGSVRGRVLRDVGGGNVEAVIGAEVSLREGTEPRRRIPSASGTYLTTDSSGWYEASGLVAGQIQVAARDPLLPGSGGTTTVAIDHDWQVVSAPDIVLSQSVGKIRVLVRNPESGAPVPDALVTLDQGFTTVADRDGVAVFASVPLGLHQLSAFDAPTARSGRVEGLRLEVPGQVLETVVLLDQRGEIRGTLFDTSTLNVAVGGAAVQLTGVSAAGQALRAFTNTDFGDLEDGFGQGRFDFPGIPEGDYTIDALAPDSPRRATASVALIPTAPIADLALVLEQVRDVYFRLFELLSSGPAALVPDGLLSVHVQQSPNRIGSAAAYDYVNSTPEPGTDVLRFPDVLLERRASVDVVETGGELRSTRLLGVRLDAASEVPGEGTSADPFRVTLEPKGVVGVRVRDPSGTPAVSALVTVHASGVRFPGVSNAAGEVSFFGVPAGLVTAEATEANGPAGGSASGSIVFDDDTLELVIDLAPAVRATGVIYEPQEDDRLGAGPDVPAIGIVVELDHVGLPPRTTTTDAAGRYFFDGLLEGAYVLHARSEDGARIGSVEGVLAGPDGLQNVLPSLTLDGSTPRILSIAPAPGAEQVSRSAAVEVLFSERLDSTRVPPANTSIFRVLDAAGVEADGAWSSTVDDAGRQVVHFEPSTPLQNDALYSLSIRGGTLGVRDRVGRLLTDSGSVGSSFRTSDTIGPSIIGVEPNLATPVAPTAALRVDFSEAVVASGTGPIAEIVWLDDLGTERPVPISVSRTRQNFSVRVEPLPGLDAPGDSGHRRLVVSNLEDERGNAVTTEIFEFRIHDGRAPRITELIVPGVTDGTVRQGAEVRIVPVVTDLDDTIANALPGDLARVDYYLDDPSAGDVGPVFSAASEDFAFEFVAAYVGDGTSARPFPVWARAVDTSSNVSNVAFIDLEILPNSVPTLDEVRVTAVQPPSGIPYRGAGLRIELIGIDDLDASELTIRAEVTDAFGSVLDADPGAVVVRPADGWHALEAPSFELDIPESVAAETTVVARAFVVDAAGAEATAQSSLIVALDELAPRVTSLRTERVDGTAASDFRIGESFVILVVGEDDETRPVQTQVEFDRTDLLPASVEAYPVPGAPGRFETDPISVPIVVGPEDVVVTVRVLDLDENEASSFTSIRLAPEADPEDPVITWRTPWREQPGTLWPANHASPSGTGGTMILLRAEVSDQSRDAGGDLVPGELALVEFSGPEMDGGEVVLSTNAVEGTVVQSTEGPGQGLYEAAWRVPDGLPEGVSVPFEVRVVDTGGRSASAPVESRTVSARRVYEGTASAVLPSDDMRFPGSAPDGPVFLLDGAIVSVFPAEDGGLPSGPRPLGSLVLLAGGAEDGVGGWSALRTTLTVPEVTSRASVVTHYPLELTLGGVLQVGHGASIDLDGRGLRGNTSEVVLAVGDAVPAQPRAGGSHGGLGWRGRFPDDSLAWEGIAFQQPGSIYGNVLRPRDPGSGGTGETNQEQDRGGSGGGVFTLEGDAELVIEGSVTARGVAPPGVRAAGSGAGGSLHLVGRRVVGRGVVDASGGVADSEGTEGSGGGGRIVLSSQALGGQLSLRAEGARNSDHDADRRRTAGAGTIVVNELDGTGATVSRRLTLHNPTGDPVAITPLPALGRGEVESLDVAQGVLRARLPFARASFEGALAVLEGDGGRWIGEVLAQNGVATDPSGERTDLRIDLSAEQWAEIEAALPAGLEVRGRWSFDEVSVGGAAWLAVGDELDVGGALDDRTAVHVGSENSEARLALRDERPEWSVSAVPPDGAAIRPGSAITLSGSVNHPLGVDLVSLTRSDGAEPLLERRPEFDTDLDVGALRHLPITLRVPYDAPAGPLSVTWSAIDADGREGTESISWDVLPNELPTLTLAATPGDPPTVVAGFDLTVRVVGEDVEGLDRIDLEIVGPVLGELQRSVAVDGASATADFVLSTSSDADGSQPIQLTATVVDRAGAEAQAGLAVIVQPNRETRITWSLAPGASREIRPGTSTVLQLDVEDLDGLTSAIVDVVGAVETVQEARALSGTVASEQFTVVARADASAGEVEATVQVTDAVGSSTTTAPLVLEIVENLSPTGILRLTSGPQTEVLPGAVLPVEVSAEDVEGLERIVLRIVGPLQGAPTTFRRVVAGQSATEVFQLVVDRRAGAGQEVRIEAEVTDAYGTSVALVPLVMTVLADTEAPQISITDLPDEARAGTALEAMIALFDDVGVERLTISFDGDTAQIDEPGGTFAWRLPIRPDLATSRAAQLEVRAVDYAGNEGVPVLRTVQLVPDEPPTVSISDVRPTSPVLPGSTLEIDVSAEDDLAVDRLTVSVLDPDDGTVITTSTFFEGRASVQRTVSASLPVRLPPSLEIHAQIADSLGREADAAVGLTTAADVSVPSVQIDSFPAGNTVVSGDQVTFVVRSDDDVGVDSSRLLLDGVEVATGADYLTFLWAAPPVADETAYEFAAEAADFADPVNVGTALRTILVRPNTNPQVPTVEFECPSTGALFPEGYAVTLRLRAGDDQAVQRIELFEGAATLPFAQIDGSTTSAELFGTTSFLLSPSVTDLHEIRAVVFDYAGNSAEESIEIAVAPGTVDLHDDVAVAGGTVNDWAALESETVVLRAGMLTLDAGRRFGGLILLEGATLTHAPWTDSLQPAVDLLVDGPVSIECGAGVDVTGRGYPRDVSYPGTAVATGTEHGGSHLGEGGTGVGSGVPGATFGSVYWPEEAGGTGISGTGRGGGVVVISAQGAVIDGGVVADGAPAPGTFDVGGAGGSVRLDVVGALDGHGVLSARGGDAGVSDRGSGGGGSLAVLHGGNQDDLTLELDAAGSPFGRPGGAGTVYRFGADSVYGDLLIDNAPQTEISRSTVLPALGAGTVLSFDGTWLELDRAPEIPNFFVNHFVRLGDPAAPLGEWRILQVDGSRVRLDAQAGALAELGAGTPWEGVYLFDSLEIANGAHLASADPIEVAGTHVVRGVVETRRIIARDLILESGATLRHPMPAAGTVERLEIDVSGAVVIEPGASIDVSGRGYGIGESYPGVALPADSENGGSHLGEGGILRNAAGATYGSVVRPQEAGTQGTSGGGRGGGVLRLRAGSLQLVDSTSAIRSNGGDGTNTFDTGGAGGSIWITVSGEISGSGVIEARGGVSRFPDRGSGGGGAIAIEYGSMAGSVLSRASAAGGAFGRTGAAGTILLRRAGQMVGDLVVDNGSPGATERWTQLPALGSGVAAAGSGGAALETGRAEVAGFFVGHWVEVASPSGAIRGRWRIRSISGGRLDLEDPNGGVVAVVAGDSWSGLHLFDGLQTRGQVRLVSDDPIEFGGAVHIDGDVAMRSLVGLSDLTVSTDATLRHPMPAAGTEERLEIDVSGAVVIEPGASIDVSGRGFGMGESYAGIALPTDSENGGSHLGEGGVFRNAAGSTYGSVVRPQEAGTQGTSGGGRGGGVLRLRAGSLQLVDSTSAIRSNGGDGINTFDTGGAGGSIWMTLSGEITGSGVIEARGGVSRFSDRGSGGGGAIAIEYGSATGSVLSRASAAGGAFGRTGAAGTVLLRRADQTFGDLVVDNGSPGATERWTQLPALGSGVAAAGSGGAALETGRAEIAGFFVGHWVELASPSGSIRGRWRIRSISGGRLDLEDPDGGVVTVAAGDSWSGLHLFDGLQTRGQVRLVSDDGIEFVDSVRIGGDVAMRSLVGTGDLAVAPGATLSHPLPAPGMVERLEIDVAGAVVIEPGASIDVSGRGYGIGEAYLGVALPGNSENGGSHLGEGGVFDHEAGVTYGSVVRPQEAGTQGVSFGGRGGGVLRLRAGSLELVDSTSAIRSNGGDGIHSFDTGGAGGSIWITVSGEVSGAGVIEARGGVSKFSSRGSGGGGAVAVEYESTSGTVLNEVTSAGGAFGRTGGAGTVLLRRSDQMYGDLVVENQGVATDRSTILPSLGSGVAAPGSSGESLVIDAGVTLQPYFEGHWIELRSADGTLLGVHQIVDVDASTATITLDASDLPSADVGVLWQAVYRFDTVTSGVGVTLESDDPLRIEDGGTP